MEVARVFEHRKDLVLEQIVQHLLGIFVNVRRAWQKVAELLRALELQVVLEVRDATRDAEARAVRIRRLEHSFLDLVLGN